MPCMLKHREMLNWFHTLPSCIFCKLTSPHWSYPWISKCNGQRPFNQNLSWAPIAESTICNHDRMLMNADGDQGDPWWHWQSEWRPTWPTNRQTKNWRTLETRRQDILSSHGNSSNHWSIKAKDATTRLPHSGSSHIGRCFLNRLLLQLSLPSVTLGLRLSSQPFCKRHSSNISLSVICRDCQTAITCLLRGRLRSPLLRHQVQTLRIPEVWVGPHELLFHEHWVHCVCPDIMEIQIMWCSPKPA